MGNDKKEHCLWCSAKVDSGMRVCFTSWSICDDCLHKTKEPDNAHRWYKKVFCFICDLVVDLGYKTAETEPALYLCPCCIEKGKDIKKVSNSFQRINQ